MLATSAPILSTGFSRRDRLGLAATPKHVDMEMPFYHDDTLTLALFSPVPLVSAPMSPVQIPPPLHTSTPLPQSTVESPSPSDNQMNPTEDLRNNPNSRNQNSQINRQRTTISRIGLTLNLDQPALDLTTRFCPNETTSTTVPNTHTTTAALPSKKQTARTLTTGSAVDDVAVLILGTTEDESNLTIVPNPWLDMNSEVKATNEAEALPCLGISGPTSDECTLTSPDLGLLKLASPELERLVLASAHSVFSTVSTPTSTVHVGTHEQEGFAAGFMLALAELQEKTTSEDGRMMGVSTEEELDSMPSVGPALESVRPGNPQNSSSGEAQNCNLATQASLLNLNRDRQSVKEEPQRVPEAGEYVHREDESCSRKGPLLSPPARERARAERKRLRNRVAASKCRKKKLERIARLEEKVKDLRSQNGELVAVAGALRRQVAALKQRVMYHVTSGCHLILSQQLEPH